MASLGLWSSASGEDEHPPPGRRSCSRSDDSSSSLNRPATEVRFSDDPTRLTAMPPSRGKTSQTGGKWFQNKAGSRRSRAPSSGGLALTNGRQVCGTVAAANMALRSSLLVPSVAEARLAERVCNWGRRAGERDSAARIRVNVSGQYYDLRLRVLNTHPDTLLGDPRKRSKYYDAKRKEYFFDRHRPSFEAIFNYYLHGGKLKRPHQISDEIFLTEILFHELEAHVVAEYKRSEGYTEEVMTLPKNACLAAIWKLFEYPETSNCAFCVAIVSVSMTLTAIVLLCIETMPAYVARDCLPNKEPNWRDEFFIVETICNIWFTFELLVRFASCPSQMSFWRDFKNPVDVIAVVPYYVTLFTMWTSSSCTSNGVNSSAVLAFLRVIRLVRIFKLTKHSVGLQVLILTFRASIEGLGMFLVALTVSMLVYSSAIYYAEHNVKDSQIQSIPDAFWWAIITMTTVGYGDKVPVGWIGRMIGAACAISGILTLAIPVPIIAGHFNRFYAHKTGRARLQLSTG